jgi:hypothetical protein
MFNESYLECDVSALAVITDGPEQKRIAVCRIDIPAGIRNIAKRNGLVHSRYSIFESIIDPLCFHGHRGILPMVRNCVHLQEEIHDKSFQ